MKLHHVSGDEVVFLFDHSQGSQPRVGDSYYVREIGSHVALVVQIVALETFDYPSLSEVLMRQLMEASYGEGRVQTFSQPTNAPQVDNLGQARAKIRRRLTANGQWTIWNGWLPSRNVEISRVADEDLFKQSGLLDPKYSLSLGQTLDGRELEIAGRSYEKINIITALKGMGKSHLAKVIILELIKQGMPCIVFDMNREYIRLPKLKVDGEQVTEAGVVVLSATKNFRVSIEGFGRRALVSLFKSYSPPDNTLNEFEFQINQMFDQIEKMRFSDRDTQTSIPFINLEMVRSRFDRSNQYVREAVISRLKYIEGLNLFARTEDEGISFDEQYALCAQQGGALVIDLAHLTSTFARETFVEATLDMVERVAATQAKLPFVFFEEAHMYAKGERIENLVTRARHLGITSTFVTNMVTQLNETVLRQVDNLFLLYLPHKDDVRHVSKSATTDEETVSAFAQRIEKHHAMVIGQATGNYPIVFKVATPDGVQMAGETKYAFPE